jgi:hypothetical protein
VIPEPPSGRIIPLFPGISRGTEDRRAALRAAVIQVVGHLVERAVPPAQRVPLFDQARDLLDEAGWGPGRARRRGRTRACPGRAAARPRAGRVYELRLPLAPYRFVWRDEAAVDADKHATDAYTEERYRHADGTHTIIREYRADGSYHIMSDRGEIELVDNANDPDAPDPVSVVRLP